MKATTDGAGVILYVDDQVLLQRRTRDAPDFPSFCNIFGGRVEVDEEPEMAVLREIHEELGLSLSTSDLSSLGVVTVLRGE